MKYSDGKCKICMTNAENAEHLLTECISLDNIWNETECLIQNYIDGNYAITSKRAIARYFQNDEGTDFSNDLLTLTRWT